MADSQQSIRTLQVEKHCENGKYDICERTSNLGLKGNIDDKYMLDTPESEKYSTVEQSRNVDTSEDNVTKLSFQGYKRDPKLNVHVKVDDSVCDVDQTGVDCQENYSFTEDTLLESQDKANCQGHNSVDINVINNLKTEGTRTDRFNMFLQKVNMIFQEVKTADDKMKFDDESQVGINYVDLNTLTDCNDCVACDTDCNDYVACDTDCNDCVACETDSFKCKVENSDFSEQTPNNRSTKDSEKKYTFDTSTSQNILYSKVWRFWDIDEVDTVPALNFNGHKHDAELIYNVKEDNSVGQTANDCLENYCNDDALLESQSKADSLDNNSVAVNVNSNLKTEETSIKMVNIFIDNLKCMLKSNSKDVTLDVDKLKFDENQAAISNVDLNKITHCKDPVENETKAFTDEDKNIGNLTELLLSHNIHVRTDILVFMVPSARWRPQAINDIPWNWLNEEKWRLHTYSNYPHNASKSAILLAESGFAYLGSGKGSDDKVICYFCCAVKQDWQAWDNISVIHSNLSPQCPMVTGVNCTNVPMTVPESGITLFNQLSSSRNLFSNESTQNGKHEIDHDGIECDSPHVNDQRKQPGQHPSDRHKGHIPPAHVSRPIQMASQTIMGPASASRQSATIPATHSQTSGSLLPSTVTNQNSENNVNVNVSHPERLQTSGAQETHNNMSSARPRQTAANAARTSQTLTQNIQPVLQSAPTSSTTVTSSTATLSTNVISSAADTSSSTVTSSQISESSSSGNQNVSTVVSTSAGTPATASTVSNTSNSNPATNTNQPYQTAVEGDNPRPAGRSPTYVELGIITERPKRYEYAMRLKRLESFEPWPRDHHLKKEDLADAGFYYAGYGDCARCFYCGGGLRNWEDNDNVWVEHARWFPKCAFIRQAMGQQFVEAVQDLNRSNDQITFAMVTEKMGATAASFQLDTKYIPLKRDPAVVTVSDMGYDEQDIMEAAAYVKETFGMLSADKLFEKLEQDGKQRTKRDTPADSQAIRNTRDITKDEKIIHELREKNSQLRQQTVCKICMDKEVAVVFLPCGHLVSCTDCAAALKDCPVCRNSVRGIVRAFMA